MARRRSRISLKGVLVTAGIAVGAVLGYDWYKANTSGPVAGHRPGTVA